MRKIAAGESISWLLPLLFVSLCLLLRLLAQGSLNTHPETTILIPNDFQYYLPEEQERLQNALALENGPLFVFFFPAIGSLGALWFEWVLMSAILTGGLRLGGGKVLGRSIRTLCAWSFLPIALRYVVQALYILVSGDVIRQSGLSSLLSASAGMSAGLPVLMLSVVDLYLFWQILLLVKGSRLITGFPLWRVALPVILAAGAVILFDGLTVTVAGMLGAAITG